MGSFAMEYLSKYIHLSIWSLRLLAVYKILKTAHVAYLVKYTHFGTLAVFIFDFVSPLRCFPLFLLLWTTFDFLRRDIAIT